MPALRSIADRLASAAGLIERRVRAMRSGLTVLMYHRVLPEDQWHASPLPNLVMPEPAFREQMRLFAARFTPMTMSAALAALGCARDHGAKPLLAVTFDDGYLDNARFAAPILRETGVPATFFVVAGLLGTDTELWFDRAARLWAGADAAGLSHAAALAGRSAAPWSANPALAEWMAFLKALAPRVRDAALDAVPPSSRTPPRREIDRLMPEDQVVALARAGHEIASHTWSHPMLTRCDEPMLLAEIGTPKAHLERLLARPVPGFSAPNGTYDARVLDAVRAAGYTYAVTTAPGRASSGGLEIPRIDMNPRNVTSSLRHDAPACLAEISLLHHDLRRRLGKA